MPGRQATATMLIPLKAVGEPLRFSDETRAEAGKDGEAQKVTISQSGPNAFWTRATSMAESVAFVPVLAKRTDQFLGSNGPTISIKCVERPS